MSAFKTYSKKDLAESLDMSLRWVEDKLRAREIPCLKVGNRVRFTQRHVDQIIEQLEQPATAATPATPLPLAKRRRKKATA